MSKSKKAQITESEIELIEKAQSAVSQCNWVVGECASKWTKKFAKSRTDGDFGEKVGLTGDQIYQRRRVFETFGDVYTNYPSLKWSHFYVALNWDNAPECLQWAEENQTTVAEMKAWRRSLQGEDLSDQTPIDEWGIDPNISFVPSQSIPVRDPQDLATTASVGSSPGSAGAPDQERRETATAVAREAGNAGDDYTPFRKGAGSPPPKDSSSTVAVVEKPTVAADQLAKRMSVGPGTNEQVVESGRTGRNEASSGKAAKPFRQGCWRAQFKGG